MVRRKGYRQGERRREREREHDQKSVREAGRVKGKKRFSLSHTQRRGGGDEGERWVGIGYSRAIGMMLLGVRGGGGECVRVLLSSPLPSQVPQQELLSRVAIFTPHWADV